MNYIHEDIKLSDETTWFKIFSFKAKNLDKIIHKHWHNSIEILYVVEGSLNLWVSNEEFKIKAGEIVLVNANEIHSTQSKEENHVIILQIPYMTWVKNGVYLENMYFELNSIKDKEGSAQYYRIKEILNDMNLINNNPGNSDLINDSHEGYKLKLNSLLLEMMFILVTSFKKRKSEYFVKSEKYMVRLEEIVNIIKEEYHEEITLDTLGKKCNLSPYYISRFFSKYMGITFIDYVNSIRLQKAYEKLVSTDYDMTRIALDSGFPNVKSFTRSFKKIYGETPYQYRLKINRN